MRAFFISLTAVFVAELGDKSQLLALALAARYSAAAVMVGLAISTVIMHTVAVAGGALVGNALPAKWIGLAAGLAFIGFAAWTLREHFGGEADATEEEAEAERQASRGRPAVITAMVAFLLAELGDKTQLVVLTLATREGVVGTWAGAVTGMIAADALAVIAGKALGDRLPERAVKLGAAVLFVAFGIWVIIDALSA